MNYKYLTLIINLQYRYSYYLNYQDLQEYHGNRSLEILKQKRDHHHYYLEAEEKAWEQDLVKKEDRRFEEIIQILYIFNKYLNSQYAKLEI